MLLARRILAGGARTAEDVDTCRAPGRILTISSRQSGAACIISVTTNLTGDVYYQWYRNGVYVGATTRAEKTFMVGDDQQVEIDCYASRWKGFDGNRHAPASFHGYRRCEWIRSADSDVKHYLAQYQKDGGDWTTFRKIEHVAGVWTYAANTPLLVEGSTYGLRVVPVDTSDLEGTPLSLDTLTIVRTPVVTAYAVSWDSGTGKVTFSD